MRETVRVSVAGRECIPRAFVLAPSGGVLAETPAGALLDFGSVNVLPCVASTAWALASPAVWLVVGSDSREPVMANLQNGFTVLAGLRDRFYHYTSKSLATAAP